MGKNETVQPNRIREVREAQGLTLEQLEEATEISTSYLSRMESGKRNVSLKNLQKIADALGVTARELVSGNEPAPAPTSTVEQLPNSGSFGIAKVDGSVQAGAFLALEVFDDDLGEVISAPRDPVFPFARQRAYRVKGDSMNQAKPAPMNDGDYVICAIWEDLNMPEKDGLNVVVQQTTADGQLRERSVKEMRVFPDRVEFHPRSSNPAYKPIVVSRDYHTDDGKEVTILALVRYVFNNQALPI